MRLYKKGGFFSRYRISILHICLAEKDYALYKVHILVRKLYKYLNNLWLWMMGKSRPFRFE